MKCKVDDCNGNSHAYGLCRKHHARFMRNGSTESKYDKSGYAKLGGVKDPRPGARGSLAVNLVNDIKCKALKRGNLWELTHEQAFELIKSACVYCGFKPSWPENRVGIDRVFNDTGYKIDNCVPCCFTCNSAKKEKSLEEFKQWVSTIHGNLFPK